MTEASGTRGILAVARMEFQLAMVSRLSLLLGAFFIIIVAAGTNIALSGIQRVPGVLNDRQTQTVLMVTITVTLAFLGPLVPILSSVLSIVEERSTRTIEMLLSRPVTRRGLVLGKILGRTAHVVVISWVGIAAGLLVVSDRVRPDLGQAAVLIGLAMLLAMVWVSLAMLLSSFVRRPINALVSAFGLWFLMLVWGGLPFFDWIGMGGLKALTNPNTLFLGAARKALFPAGTGDVANDVVQTALGAFTSGLNIDYALPGLVVFLVLAAAAATEAFHRQEEAAG